MDRKKWAAKFKEKKKQVIGVFALILVAGVGVGIMKGQRGATAKHAEAKHAEAKPEAAKKAEETATVAHGQDQDQVQDDGAEETADADEAPTAEAAPVAQAEPDGFYQAFRRNWKNVWAKLGELEQSEIQNEQLKLENAHLRNQLEAKTFAIEAEEARRLTDAFGRRIEAETGSPVGRLLSSISYQPPSNLLPRQLYALGVSYFKAREDEKAAVIFTQLIESRSTEEFKTPRNFLLAAVAWYRLDHFEAADAYLSRAMELDGAKQFEEASEKDSRSTEELATFAQIRLWRALAAKRLGDEKTSQHWLVELVDHHPGAQATQWVNREENLRGREKSGRGVASEKKHD